MAIRVLRPGEALAVTELGINVKTEFAVAASASGELPDLIALLVSASGKVRSDDDLIFYNNTVSGDGAVSWAGRSGGAEWLRVTLTSVDADVDRVVLGCAGGLLNESLPGQVMLKITDPDGRDLATADCAAEPGYRAMILLEIYRRQGAWRCRLLAQGYAGGLSALVTEHGVEVDEPVQIPQTAPAPDTHRPMPTTPAPAPPRPTPPAAAKNSVAPPAWPMPTTSPQPGSGAFPQSVPPRPDTSSGQPVHEPSAGLHPPAVCVPPVHPGSSQGQPQWSPPADQTRRGGLFTSRKRAQLEAQNAELNRLLTTSGALDNAAVAAERQRLADEVARLAAEADRRRADLAGLDQRLNQIRASIAVAEGDAELTEVGIYNYRHRLDDSIAYKAQLDVLRDRIKACAKAGRAVTGNTNWTVNGSLPQGRRMVNEVSKLMLRAYNADADHAVRTMRAYKLDSALVRLDATRSTIARLGTTMTVAVTDEYHRLRRNELELTADYLNKFEEEKERQRQLREEQREQQRADAEYARQQESLERDRAKYSDALARLEAGAGDPQQIVQIRSQLTSVNAALADLSYRRANMRLGWVYVISNIGAFGQRMVKIGMTRRVDPMDRVRELGDASVPFRFDVHALIFSEDAVALETALHQRFAAQKVNRVNQHREFFYVTPAEVRQALAELDTNFLVEYREEAIAEQWRQSGGPDRALLPT